MNVVLALRGAIIRETPTRTIKEFTVTLETIEQAAAGLTRQEKLQLIEHLAQSLRQPDESSSESRGTESGVPEKRAILDDLRRELATLPVASPEDGLSNRDHDRVLYGADQ